MSHKSKVLEIVISQTDRGKGYAFQMVFILYDIVLLLTLLLQDMMVWARDPGYSVAEVAISRADRI